MSFAGMDALREWLVSQGFKIAADPIGSRNNACNWYAYRRSELPARECECNEGKPAQIVIKPFLYLGDAGEWESVEVDVTGEAGGDWFKLAAYSMKSDRLRERLPKIEAMLIAAWNALLPAAE